MRNAKRKETEMPSLVGNVESGRSSIEGQTSDQAS